MILIFAFARAFACPDLGLTLDGAVTHLLSADADAVQTDLNTAETALSCTTTNAESVARYFLVRGAAAEFAQAGAGAPFFAAARRASPTTFDDRLGGEIRAAWQVATEGGTATLALDTNHAGGWVNGVRVKDWPITVGSGWNVVQVVTTDGRTVMFGKSVSVPAGDAALIQTGLPETGARPIPGASASTSAAKKRVISPGWLIASGVVAAAGGGMAYAAHTQGERMNSYTSVEAVDLGWNRERQFAYSAYACWGAAGVLGGLSFVLP